MSDSTSSLSILSNIFTAPERAFKDIQQSYPILLPLLLIIAAQAIVAVLLFSSIDFEWYVDYMVEATAGDKSGAEQDQIRQGFEMMSPTTMSAMAVVGSAIGIPVIFAIFSLYFVIVSNITNDGFQFKQWFSFICWTSLPMLVDVLASIMTILTASNGQFAPESINPLTLNELFFGLDAMQGLGNIMASTSITLLATISLLTIGYAKWTEKSLAKSFMIIMVPYVIYYGIRFLML